MVHLVDRDKATRILVNRFSDGRVIWVIIRNMRSAARVRRTDDFAQDFEGPTVFARRFEEFHGVVIAQCCIGNQRRSVNTPTASRTVDEGAAFNAELPLVS